MPVKDGKLSLPFLDRLTTKIAIATVVFLFAFTTAVAFLVNTGLRRNQYGAYAANRRPASLPSWSTVTPVQGKPT